MKCMEASMFSSSLSILNNGSPTDDFSVEHGLWQGDPISPFLFILATKGLACLIKKATSIGKFVGFSIGN